MNAKHTPGPWFVSGVRYRMNGGEWHNVSRYDEAKKQDENIACVGFDPRTGLGLADARLIAAAPDMLQALQAIAELSGLTLIAPSLGDDGDKGHQIGANKAFEQAASMARAAISKVAPVAETAD